MFRNLKKSNFPHSKAEIVTHHIAHQYDEILPASLPGLEVHIVYYCESEIVFDEYGDEESNRLIHIAPMVNGQSSPFTTFPRENGSEGEKRILALLRESARQALWAEALKQAATFEPIDRPMVANHWQATGKIRFPFNVGKPEFFAG